MNEEQDIRSNPPVLMNEDEVARFIGICPRSVRNFTARGLLPVIRLGRRRLFRRDAVLAALRALETGDGHSSDQNPPVERNWHKLSRRHQRT